MKDHTLTFVTDPTGAAATTEPSPVFWRAGQRNRQRKKSSWDERRWACALEMSSICSAGEQQNPEPKGNKHNQIQSFLVGAREHKRIAYADTQTNRQKLRSILGSPTAEIFQSRSLTLSNPSSFGCASLAAVSIRTTANSEQKRMDSVLRRFANHLPPGQ